MSRGMLGERTLDGETTSGPGCATVLVTGEARPETSTRSGSVPAHQRLAGSKADTHAIPDDEKWATVNEQAVPAAPFA